MFKNIKQIREKKFNVMDHVDCGDDKEAEQMITDWIKSQRSSRDIIAKDKQTAKLSQ